MGTIIDNSDKLGIEFKIEIPQDYFFDVFKDQTIHLNIDRLKLGSFQYVDLLSSDYNKWTFVGGIVFDENSKEYVMFNSLNTRNERLDKSVFLGIFRNSIHDFRNVCLEFLNYMTWKENINIGIGFFNKASLVASWTFKGQQGSISDLTNVYKVLEVREFIQEVKTISPDISDEFYERKDNNDIVPVYFEILIEARQALFRNSLRSCLLMLYSSLEVATKYFISTMRPQTKYLIDEMQSPPLDKLYKKYITKELGFILGEGDAKIIGQMMQFRNDVAHQGKLTILYNDKYITLNRELLWEYIRRVELLIKQIERLIETKNNLK